MFRLSNEPSHPFCGIKTWQDAVHIGWETTCSFEFRQRDSDPLKGMFQLSDLRDGKKAWNPTLCRAGAGHIGLNSQLVCSFRDQPFD
jgi:hypothetical protein